MSKEESKEISKSNRYDQNLKKTKKTKKPMKN